MTLPVNGTLNCCVCGQSYADGQKKCTLCGFLVNSDLDIVSDTFVAEIDESRNQLQSKVREAVEEIRAACNLNIPGDLRLPSLDTVKTEGGYKSAAEIGLLNLRDSIKSLVEGKTPAITILDDGASQLAIYVIKVDGRRLSISEKTYDWSDLYTDYPNEFDLYRKSLILVGGLREFRREALVKWIDKIDTSGTVFHSTPYLQASHSQSIDGVLKEKVGEFQKILLERECQNRSDIKDILNRLCKLAPLSAAIEAMSASVDAEGKVTTNFVTIFPKGINIDDIDPVELSITSADLPLAGKHAMELGFYHSDDHSKPCLVAGITLEPGQTKNVELKLVSRDGQEFIAYRKDRLQTIQRLSPIPEKVDRVKPLNLILIVDCIGTKEKLDLRKFIAKELVTELSKQDERAKTSICTYSCEFYPLSSQRKPNWPDIFTCDLNPLSPDQAKVVIDKIRFFPEDEAPFPGMLELVLKKLSEAVSEEQNTYVLVIGNRPANPNADKEALMGVKEDWKECFDLLKRKARIGVLHPESEKIGLDEWNAYYEDFWEPFDAVERGSALKKLLPSTLANVTLKVPTVTVLRNKNA